LSEVNNLKCVFFRVDANAKIGYGHFFRCISLSEELLKKGYKCIFLIQNPDQFIHNLASKSDIIIECLELNSLSSKRKIDLEIKSIQRLQSKYSFDYLVIDHYKVNRYWEERAFKGFKNIYLIDDLANEPHFVNAIINPNIGKYCKDYKSINLNKAVILAGQNYSILNKSFIAMRSEAKLKRRKIQIKNILISFGASDLGKYLTSFLKNLLDLIGGHNYSFTVVCSRNDLDLILQSKLDQNTKIKFLTNLSQTELGRLYLHADFCIGAGGVSALERCLLGLPSAIVTVAKNQIPGSIEMDSLGCAVLLNPVNIKAVDFDVLLDTLKDKKKLADFSNKSFNLIDGKGVYRIISELF